MPALLERVKQQLAPKKPAPSTAPRGRATQTSEVLGAMSFEQAQGFLAPDGPLDRSRRPPRASYMMSPLRRPPASYMQSPAPAPARAPNSYQQSPAPLRPSPYSAMPDLIGSDASYMNADSLGSQRSGSQRSDAQPAKVSEGKREKAVEPRAIERAHPALGAEQLAALRQGGYVDAHDSERDRLSDDEEQTEGWALVGMRSYEKMNDARGDAHKDGFYTRYHYADEADLGRNSGGHEQTTDRADFVIELKNGRFVSAASGDALDSSNLGLPGFTFGQMMRDKKLELGHSLDADEVKALRPDVEAKGGRYIFVMDAQGTIYAGENIHKVQHHSSFMGGGAVAAAGELQVSGGRLTTISNMSGHYRPGPGFLWQAIAQMAGQGVDMSAVTAEILGAGTMNAADFLEVFDVVARPELMDTKKGLDFLREHITDAKVSGPIGKTETTYV